MRRTPDADGSRAAKYDWWCGSPCDPWEMTHAGYMRGYIIAPR